MLLAGVSLLAGCDSDLDTTATNRPAMTPATSGSAPATDSGSTSHGVSRDVQIPLSSYQPVRLRNVATATGRYAAVVPCPRDTAGEISLQIVLQTQRHTLEALTLLYAGTNATRKLNQLGNGVGYYHPATQRYYFSVAYQTISELPGNRRFSSEPYEINGWISTDTNTAGVLPTRLAR